MLQKQLPQSRQKEIEMVCLSIILPLWYIKVIKHLQCLFVVTDENDQHWKSVQIWTILSARWSVDGLPKELSGHSKTFWFFSNNLSLDQGISSCSSSLISCLPCGNSRNLPTNTSIWLLATLSLANSKWVEQNLSTCNLSFVLILWIVCNAPLLLNVLNLQCYVMLILVYI